MRKCMKSLYISSEEADHTKVANIDAVHRGFNAECQCLTTPETWSLSGHQPPSSVKRHWQALQHPLSIISYYWFRNVFEEFPTTSCSLHTSLCLWGLKSPSWRDCCRCERSRGLFHLLLSLLLLLLDKTDLAVEVSVFVGFPGAAEFIGNLGLKLGHESKSELLIWTR